jgi:Malectin-like domain
LLYQNNSLYIFSLFHFSVYNKKVNRYPDDLYDRFWWSYTKRTWKDISTTSTIALNSDFDVPLGVMQTAAITSSIPEPLFINMTAGTKYSTHYVLHFAEIQNMSSTDRREFNISVRGYLMEKGYIPLPQKYSMEVYIDGSCIDYSVSLDATSNSTLPPLLNAIELYKIILPLQVPTDGADGIIFYVLFTSSQLLKSIYP